MTQNDPAVTARLRSAFDAQFGDASVDMAPQSASEDFSDIPSMLGAPYAYWGIGDVDPQTYAEAEAAGRLARDVPSNHSPLFAPVIQPTLDTGTKALVTAALAWLARG